MNVVIKELWFKSMAFPEMGIIVQEDTVSNERKCYIGIANGRCRSTDVNRIMAFGVVVSPDELREIADTIEGK